jgi:hypothetical protein
MTIITKGMGAIYKNRKSLQIKKLRNKALAVLGLGTAGAVGAGAVGSVMSSQRKNRKRK